VLAASCDAGQNADSWQTVPRRRPRQWYYRPWSVVFLLFFVLGPFGLPLLWKSAGFSRGSKIVLTVAVMACSALPIETVLVAVRAAMEQIGLVGAPMTVGISS